MVVAPGQTLSHFRLEEEIGAGGMGVVFRARDLHLERDVAIKVLPAGTLPDSAARIRFRKEALALSRVNHPNIATVFDFDTQDDTDFLVMEFVPGMSLDEKLADGALVESEIVALSTQLVDGLAAAHDQRIVHRDLKPANLRVMPDGRLKILDFGLARLLRAEAEGGATETATQTRGIVGTFPYMAPEQLQGGQIDARTDIYATGAVLYEMATGYRPFRETNMARLFSAIAHEVPESPRSHGQEISTSLESVILKALEKDPARRYQTVVELGEDLKRLSAGFAVAAPRRRKWPRWALLAAVSTSAITLVATIMMSPYCRAPRISSLAVLPLANLSGDPDQEYFADGMTDALITDLGKIGALRVTARPSVLRFKGSELSLTEIADRLGVDALIIGSAMPVGDRARITMQLIDAETERILWSESYDREVRDILAVQGNLARAIAGRIEVTLTPAEEASLTTTRSVDPDAHRAYLRGRHHFDRFTREGFLKAIESFERAIEIDPEYAEAYSSLGYSCFALGQAFAMPDEEMMPRARKATDKALALDDTSVEAWLTRGLLKHVWEWDWQEAEPAYRRAIELNPNYAFAHTIYAYYLLAVGRTEEGVMESRLGVELDPMSLISGAHLAEILYLARRYDEAVEECERVLEIDPNFVRALAMLVWVYEDTDRYEKAFPAQQRACVLVGTTPADCLGRQKAWDRGGAEEYWRFSLELDRESPAGVSRARIAAHLGMREEALAFLELAYDRREGDLVLGFLDTAPYDFMRGDPRFQDLVRRIGPDDERSDPATSY